MDVASLPTSAQGLNGVNAGSFFDDKSSCLEHPFAMMKGVSS